MKRKQKTRREIILLISEFWDMTGIPKPNLKSSLLVLYFERGVINLIIGIERSNQINPFSHTELIKLALVYSEAVRLKLICATKKYHNLK